MNTITKKILSIAFLALMLPVHSQAAMQTLQTLAPQCLVKTFQRRPTLRYGLYAASAFTCWRLYRYVRPHQPAIDYTSSDLRKAFKQHVDKIEKVVQEARSFFDTLLAQRGFDPRTAGAIIFDMDDTLISKKFTGVDSEDEEIIEPVVTLFHRLRSSGFFIDIVTNRPNVIGNHDYTVKMLASLGITGYRKLYLRDDANFKYNYNFFGWKLVMRNKIADNDKTPILASFGDKQTDFLRDHRGAYSTGVIFKLPDVDEKSLTPLYAK